MKKKTKITVKKNQSVDIHIYIHNVPYQPPLAPQMPFKPYQAPYTTYGGTTAR